MATHDQLRRDEHDALICGRCGRDLAEILRDDPLLDDRPGLIRLDPVMNRDSCDDCWAGVKPNFHGHGNPKTGNRSY